MPKENSLFLLASHKKGDKTKHHGIRGSWDHHEVSGDAGPSQLLCQTATHPSPSTVSSSQTHSRSMLLLLLDTGLRLSLCCLWPKCASPSRTTRVLFTFRALPGSPSPPSFPADSLYLAHVPVVAFITLTQSSACRVSPEAKVLFIPNL